MIGVDLGSNTIRLCQMDENLSVNLKFERVVGSARGLDENGLSSKAMARIESAILHICQNYDLKEARFCATEAFRMAKNARGFFDEIFAKFGIKFEIISPEVEANLTRKGVLNRLNLLKMKYKNPAIIDLGGASTEISNNEISKSFSIGIIRCFEKDGLDFSKLEKSCFLAYDFLKNLKFDCLVLTSGVPTTLAALKNQMNYENYDANLINGSFLEKSDFDFGFEMLSNLDKNGAEIWVGKDRKDLVLCGILMLKAILKDHFNDKFLVVDDGLREGICVDYFEKRSKNER